MNRFWIALALLAALLGLGVFTTNAMGRVSEELALTLARASDAAGEADWERAEDLLRQAKDHWESCRSAIATAASHEPMEEIDALLRQLELYLRQREEMGFVLCCEGLRCRIEAMGEAQAVNWWSLL